MRHRTRRSCTTHSACAPASPALRLVWIDRDDVRASRLGGLGPGDVEDLRHHDLRGPGQRRDSERRLIDARVRYGWEVRRRVRSTCWWVCRGWPWAAPGLSARAAGRAAARSLALEERRRLSPGVNDEAEHADARAAARTKALDSETRLSYSDQRYGSSRRSWALRCYLLSSC